MVFVNWLFILSVVTLVREPVTLAEPLKFWPHSVLVVVSVAALPVVFWLPVVLTPGKSILADPSKLTPPIFLAVCSVVAVVAFPLNAAVIVPAVKLPLASLATIALAVFAFVAVVAVLDTLPVVDIVASFVSAIAAAEFISAFTIESAVIAADIVISALPLNEVAVPVTSPLIAMFLAVCSVVAVVAFPLNAAVTVPALKLTLESLATIALFVFELVAVVAEFDTLPAVDIGASFVSTIPAAEFISALTIESAVIAADIVISAIPLNDVAVPVTSPLIAIVLAVANVVAVDALPTSGPLKFAA
jgi:hypothetical protein